MGDIAGKALVMFAHGEGWVLVWQANQYVGQYIEDAGGSRDGFDVKDIVNDYDQSVDGLWYCEMDLIDDGPGDWPGSRECALQMKNWRLATADEWKAHRAGDWPWDPEFVSEEPPDVASPYDPDVGWL